MTQPPEPLVTWVEALAGHLTDTAKRLRANARPDPDTPVSEWLSPLLADFSATQDISQQATHVLSAYALRGGIMGASNVARLTGVTITAATNRAASKVTRDAWPNAFGERPEQ